MSDKNVDFNRLYDDEVNKALAKVLAESLKSGNVDKALFALQAVLKQKE